MIEAAAYMLEIMKVRQGLHMYGPESARIAVGDLDQQSSLIDDVQLQQINDHTGLKAQQLKEFADLTVQK